MSKTIFAICVAIAIGAVMYVVVFQNKNETPIVDEACPNGYERVGEGCMTHQEACELQGDNYFYDVSASICISH